MPRFPRQGRCLAATSLLDGSYFEAAIIFIHSHNEAGAAGFIVNRRFPRKLNELVEFRHHAAIELYEGGPVDQEHIFFLHRASSAIAGGTPVTEDLFFGGNFNNAVTALTNGQLSSNEVKIFIGYCGWDAGELEGEIAEGSWTAMNIDATEIFNANIDLP